MLKNKIHHEKETRGQPYNVSKKRNKKYVKLVPITIYIFTYSDFNLALNSLKDSASTTYCGKLFHSFTRRIKNEYL